MNRQRNTELCFAGFMDYKHTYLINLYLPEDLKKYVVFSIIVSEQVECVKSCGREVVINLTLFSWGSGVYFCFPDGHYTHSIRIRSMLSTLFIK